MARTQAVYYRDRRGVEPVDRFIEALPAKRAAKIDDYVEEHLSRKPPDAPPTEFPITSQIEGELRELRVRFANTHYRVLYQRSGNLVVLLHAIEKNTGRYRLPRSSSPSGEWRISGAVWMPNTGRRRGRLVKTRCRRAEEGIDYLIQIDKLGGR